MEEQKTTKKSSYPLKLDEWLAIRDKAQRMGRAPKMVIEFQDPVGQIVVQLEITDA